MLLSTTQNSEEVCETAWKGATSSRVWISPVSSSTMLLVVLALAGIELTFPLENYRPGRVKPPYQCSVLEQHTPTMAEQVSDLALGIKPI